MTEKESNTTNQDRNSKQKTNEYRIKASEFDAIMRRALGTPPLPERKPKAAKKTRKKAKTYIRRAHAKDI